MNTPNTPCPQCGKVLPEGAPEGLCPHCLIEGALSPVPGLSESDDVLLAQVGQAFPQLEAVKLLGIGGMGRVYQARQPTLDRLVALKVLPGDKADNPEWIERFTREARALARLNHPNIVQVYDFGTATIGGHTQPYLMMEYVDGVNLRQAMQACALSAREALAIVPKLCDALHYAHEHHVLHRDIKPENVLIDSEGLVKLVDFGLAKLRDEAQTAFTLTQSGAKLGTIAYMAPEQIEKPGDVDHRADIYSLGVVFYEMLTGELPLGRFPTPSEASGVDPRLDGVVMRTLEKNREKRFQDAGAMKSGIETAAMGSLPVTELPRWDTIGYEYQSKARLGSWPLVHICFTKDPETGKSKCARGIIAIGMHAQGVLALGLFAYGLFAWGVVSAGVLSMGVVCVGAVSSGVVSIGLLAAYGVCAVAPLALGVTSVGYIAAGVTAWGSHVAAQNGVIDPLAARIGDEWIFRCMRWSNLMQAVMLTSIMGIGAFASWRAGKPKGHVLLFAALRLLGPLSLLTSTQGVGTGPMFSDRLAKQERQTRAAALETQEKAPIP